MERIIVTGGTGCIGAATIYHLLSHAPVESITVLSRSGNPRLIHLWQSTGLERLQFENVDLGNASAIEDILHQVQPTRLIHLGALQSPACDADPIQGMEINAGGTLLLFAAIERLQLPLERFVFASSAAVYGKRNRYPGATVKEHEMLAPPNYYGVWKVAGEHLAALFHERTGIPVVSLRLNTTFGPGRDQGKTSAPTSALKAIARGAARGTCEPFRMPYRGRENYHYVEDVGAHFSIATMSAFSGCAAFNIKGCTIAIEEFLRIAGEVADERGWGEACDLGVADDADENLFICDLDDTAVEARFPGVPRTPVREGIERSLDTFHRLAELGQLD